MSARILKGTKQEIAETLARLSGEVREAIVFVDEPPASPATAVQSGHDIFAEMQPFMVDVHDLDDSRQTIYTRLPGE